MQLEAAQFRDSLGEDATRFRSLTYQDRWSQLQPRLDVATQDYSEYMQRR